MKKYNKGKFCGGNIRSRNQNNTAKKPSREKKIMKSKYLVLLWQSVSDTTTGGNWQWSPARINCLIPDNAKGMVNQSGANAASSMTMRSKFFFTWKKNQWNRKIEIKIPFTLSGHWMALKQVVTTILLLEIWANSLFLEIDFNFSTNLASDSISIFLPLDCSDESRVLPETQILKYKN